MPFFLSFHHLPASLPPFSLPPLKPTLGMSTKSTQHDRTLKHISRKSFKAISSCIKPLKAQSRYRASSLLLLSRSVALKKSFKLTDSPEDFKLQVTSAQNLSSFPQTSPPSL
ncbi:hypothetical protein B0H12DRAFT_1151717 [Mycena haematopus]|nr:hypothetical protein B0H12DRAFT_1151717 [Mycena haematopus]